MLIGMTVGGMREAVLTVLLGGGDSYGEKTGWVRMVGR